MYNSQSACKIYSRGLKILSRPVIWSRLGKSLVVYMWWKIQISRNHQTNVVFTHANTVCLNLTVDAKQIKKQRKAECFCQTKTCAFSLLTPGVRMWSEISACPFVFTNNLIICTMTDWQLVVFFCFAFLNIHFYINVLIFCYTNKLIFMLTHSWSLCLTSFVSCVFVNSLESLGFQSTVCCVVILLCYYRLYNHPVWPLKALLVWMWVSWHWLRQFHRLKLAVVILCVDQLS